MTHDSRHLVVEVEQAVHLIILFRKELATKTFNLEIGHVPRLYRYVIVKVPLVAWVTLLHATTPYTLMHRMMVVMPIGTLRI